MTDCEGTMSNANLSRAPLKVEASVLMLVRVAESKEFMARYHLHMILMARNIEELIRYLACLGSADNG